MRIIHLRNTPLLHLLPMRAQRLKSEADRPPRVLLNRSDEGRRKRSSAEGLPAVFWGALALLLLVTVICGPVVSISGADELPRAPVPKGYRGGTSTLSDPAVYGFDFSETFDRAFSGTSTGDIYDPLTMSMLRRMADDAQPPDNPRDVDPTKSRQLVERVFAIQSSRNLAALLNRSELRPFYNEVRSTFKAFQDRFRYSVQDSSDGLTVSRKKNGRRLLELNLEINPKQGLDPQIRMGEHTRFRYDFLEQRPMLEYGFNF